jgi:hypothetical protein
MSEEETLQELLAVARRANRVGEFLVAVRGYEEYGCRKFGWPPSPGTGRKPLKVPDAVVEQVTDAVLKCLFQAVLK